MHPPRKLVYTLAFLGLLAAPGCARTDRSGSRHREQHQQLSAAEATTAAPSPDPWEPIDKTFTGCAAGG